MEWKKGFLQSEYRLRMFFSVGVWGKGGGLGLKK